MSEEEWRKIPGYDSTYEVSSLGRVRTWRNRKQPDKKLREPAMLHLELDKRVGYKAWVRENEKPSLVKVCYLVLYAFSGPRPTNAIVVHINGNRFDDRLRNLIWSNPENGDVRPVSMNAKIREKQVIEIRRLYATGIRMDQLSCQFHVTVGTIRNIVYRNTWKWVA